MNVTYNYHQFFRPGTSPNIDNFWVPHLQRPPSSSPRCKCERTSPLDSWLTKFVRWNTGNNSDYCKGFTVSHELLQAQPTSNPDYKCTASVLGDMRHSDWIKVFSRITFIHLNYLQSVNVDTCYTFACALMATSLE